MNSCLMIYLTVYLHTIFHLSIIIIIPILGMCILLVPVVAVAVVI